MKTSAWTPCVNSDLCENSSVKLILRELREVKLGNRILCLSLITHGVWVIGEWLAVRRVGVLHGCGWLGNDWLWGGLGCYMGVGDRGMTGCEEGWDVTWGVGDRGMTGCDEGSGVTWVWVIGEWLSVRRVRVLHGCGWLGNDCEEGWGVTWGVGDRGMTVCEEGSGVTWVWVIGEWLSVRRVGVLHGVWVIGEWLWGGFGCYMGVGDWGMTVCEEGWGVTWVWVIGEWLSVRRVRVLHGCGWLGNDYLWGGFGCYMGCGWLGNDCLWGGFGCYMLQRLMGMLHVTENCSGFCLNDVTGQTLEPFNSK